MRKRIGKHLDVVELENPEDRINLAVAVAKAGHAREALQFLQVVRGTAPDSPLYPRVCAALTSIDYFAGAYQESVSSGSALLTRSPAEIPAELFYWRALSFAKLQKVHEATEALRTFLEKAPAAEEAPGACFFLATLYLSSGNVADAQHYFQRTAQSYPGTSFATRALEFSGKMSK